ASSCCRSALARIPAPYILSLHDALPISLRDAGGRLGRRALGLTGLHPPPSLPPLHRLPRCEHARVGLGDDRHPDRHRVRRVGRDRRHPHRRLVDDDRGRGGHAGPRHPPGPPRRLRRRAQGGGLTCRGSSSSSAPSSRRSGPLPSAAPTASPTPCRPPSSSARSSSAWPGSVGPCGPSPSAPGTRSGPVSVPHSR